MYPYLHDFFNDVFGTNWQLPFPMFGFWVAMAFLGANYIFTIELKRKEALGLMSPVTVNKMIGEKLKPMELFTNGIIGFLLGYKGVHAFFNYEDLVANPQEFLFSAAGSTVGGLIIAAVSVYFKYRDGKKQELPQPKEVQETIHPHQYVGNMTLIAAIGGILGAKLFHNLENPHELMADPVGALLSFSGLSIFGGLIVGGISVVLYARKKNLSLVHIVDACAPGLLLAYGIGRIGCQLAGDGDWGIPNDAPMPDWLSFLPEWMWAYDYPNNINGVDLKTDFARMGYESITGRAWPTPFYETVMALVLFGILWKLRTIITVPGRIFSIYLFMIGIERFFIEKIRINPDYHFFGISATQAEIISIVLMIAGIAGWFLSSRNKDLAKVS